LAGECEQRGGDKPVFIVVELHDKHCSTIGTIAHFSTEQRHGCFNNASIDLEFICGRNNVPASSVHIIGLCHERDE